MNEVVKYEEKTNKEIRRDIGSIKKQAISTIANGWDYKKLLLLLILGAAAIISNNDSVTINIYNGSHYDNSRSNE